MKMAIRDVIRKIPEWKEKSLRVTKVGGGITNKNYRIDVDEKSFFVRIPGKDTYLLGIDREREYQCNSAASLTGIAPEVTHFLRIEGVLVTRFIEGQTMAAETMRDKVTMRNAVQSIKKIHDGPSFPGTFSVFRTIEDYLEAGKRFQVPLPSNIGWMFEKAYEMEKALTCHPGILVPCHNDLLPANFIDERKKFWIIDWEYAAMGNLYFDLGNFSVNSCFNDEEDVVVVQEYFGEVSEYNLSILRLFKVLSDIREAMWAIVQMGISKLRIDYKAYGDKHFERYCKNLQDPCYAQWIDQVSR